MNKYFFFGAIIAIQLIQLRLSFSNNRKLKTIMDNQTQATEKLQQISTQLQKVGTESAATLEEVKKLKEAAANQKDLSPELAAAIDAVAAQVQVVDDLVPDALDTSNEGAGAGTTTEG